MTVFGKVFIVIATLAGLCFVANLVSIITRNHDRPVASTEPIVREAPASATPHSAPLPVVASPPVVEPSLPADEINFISAVRSFRARYQHAPNEFQKSDIRGERGQFLAGTLPDRSAQDWVGQIAFMETTSGGDGILSVKLPGGDRIRVETLNNNFLGLGMGTLIPHGSALYDQVAKLAVGTTVIFSGIFGPGDRDYLEEMSMTEEGSMTDPEFLFKFTNISPKPDR